METRTRATLLVPSVALTAVLFAAPAAALQESPAHTHIGHVATAFGRTPDGSGLLATASGEADVALQHIDLASRDTSNLEWMQRHAAHVLHAVDPSQLDGGPGSGFGLIAAAEGIAQHIEFAAGSDGASDAVGRHAVHVAAAARAVAERAREIAELAADVDSAPEYSTAEGLTGRIRTLANQLREGADVNGDGQIGWGDGEGGLAQVEQHLGFILQAEGL